MGNNQINHVDPDGGNAASVLIGMGAGAAIGFGVAAYIDYKHDGKFDMKENAWMYTGWTLGGAAVGAAVGSFFDVDWVRTGHKFGHVTHGLEITSNTSWVSGIRSGRDGHIFRKSKPANTGRGFSMGLRMGNWVLLDIRFNSSLNNKYQINFPGRWGLNSNANFRFSLFYFVWPGNKGHYKYFSDKWLHFGGPFCFFGTYNWFYEHVEPGEKKQSHKYKR